MPRCSPEQQLAGVDISTGYRLHSSPCFVILKVIDHEEARDLVRLDFHGKAVLARQQLDATACGVTGPFIRTAMAQCGDYTQFDEQAFA